MKPFAFAAVAAACWLATGAHAQTTLTVAAFPAVDKIVKSAIPGFKKLHPNVEIKLVGREYADHHNAMVTSLATGTGLPDVMAVELGFLGRSPKARRSRTCPSRRTTARSSPASSFRSRSRWPPTATASCRRSRPTSARAPSSTATTC